jgi:hypothetical protein
MTELLIAEAEYRKLAAETVVTELRGQDGQHPLVKELKALEVRRVAILRECNRLFVESKAHPDEIAA